MKKYAYISPEKLIAAGRDDLLVFDEQEFTIETCWVGDDPEYVPELAVYVTSEPKGWNGGDATKFMDLDAIWQMAWSEL